MPEAGVVRFWSPVKAMVPLSPGRAAVAPVQLAVAQEFPLPGATGPTSFQTSDPLPPLEPDTVTTSVTPVRGLAVADEVWLVKVGAGGTWADSVPAPTASVTAGQSGIGVEVSARRVAE